MREDNLYCPLPFSLEVYWTCEADCSYCIARRLNHIWGNVQKVTNPQNLEKKLKNALLNQNPKSVITQALAKKKAFYIGRKADPYQPIELETKATQEIIKILGKLEWGAVLCTKYTTNLERDFDLICKNKKYISILTEVTVGLEQDWELFENKRTSPINDRLILLKKLQDKGVNVGVRGEPFIPGFHKYSEFRETLKRIKSMGLKSFNTYNLHMNEHNMKRLLELGVDIERVWELNQDERWGSIQKKLCRIANDENMILGCPDFVNVPKNWYPCVNTCCGINVYNAFTFNTHKWRNLILDGVPAEYIINNTWEEIGCSKQKIQAKTILTKDSKEFYTFKNAGII